MAEKKKKRKAKTGMHVKAKKKSAVARAKITKGTGKIKINKTPLEILEPEYVKEIIKEPLEIAGEAAKQADISVRASGSGAISQAMAARACIAKALVAFTNNKKLREKMLHYDRTLLVDDVRRKESKKPLGRGARKKRQQSFR